MLGMSQYKKCTDICSELPSDDDEVSFIIATARIMWAVSVFDKGELSEALSHLDAATTALHQTVYMYSEMQSQIKLIRSMIASLSKGAVLSAEELPRLAPLFFEKDRFLYITALATDGFPAEIITHGTVYRSHLDAKALMSESRYKEAIPLLEGVYKEAGDSYTRYFALLDLEIACKEAEDYRSAYEYAALRMELNTKYSI